MDETREKPLHPVVAALRDEPDERYRWFVGYFVTEMVEIDYLMADLVAAVLGDQTLEARGAWGESGAKLRRFVEQAAVVEPAIRRMVDEYEDLYEERNRLVHGLYSGEISWHESDPVHGVTKLSRLRKAGGPAFEVSLHTWTDEALGELVKRAEALVQDAVMMMIAAHRA